MEKVSSPKPDYLEASIKAAQYLASLTSQQDIWAETVQLVVNFFGAALCAIMHPAPEGGKGAYLWTISDSCVSHTELEAETGEALEEVVESGFLTLRTLSKPGPLRVACLPVTVENKVAAVMLIGRKISDPIPKELLNVYLAVAGLVGTTAGRLASEKELRRYRRHLEELVEGRTTALREANEQLRHEIAERGRAEDALRMEKDNLSSILDAMGDFIYIVDSQHNIQFTNSALLRAFGPFQGRKCHEYLHNRPERCPDCRTPDVLAGETVHWEQYFPRNDKTYDVLETSLLTTTGVNKLTLLRDVTERRLMEQEKEKLEAKLHRARKLEAIGTLAGGIAHDFNNILSAIMGYTELAMCETSEDSSLWSSLEQVLIASHRAKDLVGQILAFSRMRGTKKRVHTEVGRIIKEAVKLLEATLPRTIEMRETIATEEDVVLADPTQVHQVLVNLCTNAVHAMEENGGVLEIGLADAVLDEKTAALYGDLTPGPYLRLSVTDNGPGIDEATLQRIFDPYFTTKEVGKGSGLGLAVVSGIVNRHQGAVRVASIPGKGARFDVYWPKVPRAGDTRSRSRRPE